MKKIEMVKGSLTIGHTQSTYKDASGATVFTSNYESKRISEGKTCDVDDSEAERLVELGVARVVKG